MALQDTFYIIGIIYMTLSLLLVLGLVVAIFVIRAKVVSLEKMVKEKIDFATSLPSHVGEIVEAIKALTGHKSK